MVLQKASIDDVFATDIALTRPNMRNFCAVGDIGSN